jgi:hypothetical protein
MSTHPRYEVLSAELPCRQGEQDLFLLIGGSIDLGAVEDRLLRSS